METSQIVTCVLVVACVLFVAYALSKEDNKVYYAPKVPVKESFSKVHNEKFYVYNYYKVPVNVIVSVSPRENKEEKEIVLVENVPAGKYKAVPHDRWQTLTLNSKILVKSNEKIIGESTLNIPEGGTIKALHCGMVSGQSDISILGDITKSPLGTALPRLRIVNLTPRTINLTTNGYDVLTIPSAKSLLYFGEYENGIHLGVTFKDMDGILPDFTLNKPITDLYVGIISDIEIPLYRAAKIGGEYFDDEGVFYHPLRELDNYQLHKGAFIDKSHVPRNW